MPSIPIISSEPEDEALSILYGVALLLPLVFSAHRRISLPIPTFLLRLSAFASHSLNDRKARIRSTAQKCSSEKKSRRCEQSIYSCCIFPREMVFLARSFTKRSGHHPQRKETPCSCCVTQVSFAAMPLIVNVAPQLAQRVCYRSPSHPLKRGAQPFIPSRIMMGAKCDT